jgi:hypothetical protein
MPRIARMDEVRTRALELGVYLPLGAYARLRDELTELDRTRITKLFDGLIDRGQDRLQPLERVVRRRGAEAQKSARKTVKKTSQRARAAGTSIAPKLPRVAAPKKAGDLPISGYDSLTASDIVARLQGLTQTDLARVYKYETAHEERSTILEAIDSRLTDMPIPTYDALNVDELIGRLEGLSKPDLRTVHRYEADTKGRSTILEKIDSLL